MLIWTRLSAIVRTPNRVCCFPSPVSPPSERANQEISAAACRVFYVFADVWIYDRNYTINYLSRSKILPVPTCITPLQSTCKNFGSRLVVIREC